jgi:glutaredoxin
MAAPFPAAGAAAPSTRARVGFRIALVLLLGLVLLVLYGVEHGAPRPQEPVGTAAAARLQLFYSPDCPHCHKAIAFLDARELDYEPHDVSTEAGRALYRTALATLKLERAVVPLFVYGSRHLVGFHSAETTGRELLTLIAGENAAADKTAERASIALPLIGVIDPTHHSLLTLSVLLGLADGFNPCAMWVLVYLISLIAQLGDRRKIWWIVGTFVLASGSLYFLFMTAWLNAFLLIGYIRPLTRVIALLAIGFGLDHLYGLVASRGEVACEVGDAASRQRTMQREREIVAAPVGLASLAMVIALAFAVNAIEFVCSAALPAIYTHVLASTEVSPLLHYAYILVYVFFFMLDDLIIFGLAAFAIFGIIGARYAAVSRGVGGVVLVGLGAWMLAR